MTNIFPFIEIVRSPSVSVDMQLILHNHTTAINQIHLFERIPLIPVMNSVLSFISHIYTVTVNAPKNKICGFVLVRQYEFIRPLLKNCHRQKHLTW